MTIHDEIGGINEVEDFSIYSAFPKKAQNKFTMKFKGTRQQQSYLAKSQQRFTLVKLLNKLTALSSKVKEFVSNRLVLFTVLQQQRASILLDAFLHVLKNFL
ncbi:hypothetical protein HNY73_010408 [Argiope bruennichi]|uniref:Uncharacterized protein n=1 Tax=Argiope bruennichi TaxID=94029 RepID=A0A8T0F3A9_ARGBR|nr:hypothetical protein HNY73_010408 [Argiope bruennichi]